MAKIQDLNVVTIKIKNGSLTQFFYPYGSGKYIDVSFDAYSTPALLWVTSNSGANNLYYGYGSSGEEFLIPVTAGDCVAFGDMRGAGTATYTITGSGDAVFTGAMMRFR